MSSPTPRNRVKERSQLVRNILRFNHLAEYPCQFCTDHLLPCYTMPSSSRQKSLKCTECISRGRPCVEMSWPRLERVQDDLESKIQKDTEALLELVRRIDRNKALLEQAQRRAEDKQECLVRELEADGEDLSRTVADMSSMEAHASGPSNDVFISVEDAERLLADFPLDSSHSSGLSSRSVAS